MAGREIPKLGSTQEHLPRMGRVKIAGESDVYLSVIKWGWLRRQLAGRKAQRLGIKMGFVTRYELAVFRGHPTRTLPDMPDYVFHFRDRSNALEGYHGVVDALIAGGYYGLPVQTLFEANQQKWLPGY